MACTPKWIRNHAKYKRPMRYFGDHSNAALHRIQRWLYRHNPIHIHHLIHNRANGAF